MESDTGVLGKGALLKVARRALLALALACGAAWPGGARAASSVPIEEWTDYFPCSPSSDLPPLSSVGDPSPDFCALWNPDYVFNGHRCCAKPPRRRRANKCAAARYRASYAAEMTEEQKAYYEAAEAGSVGDVLGLIDRETGNSGEQSFCGVNTGFLVRGRPLVPSDANRVKLRSPKRYLNFGTDGMIGMIEWLGRQVAFEYSSAEYAGVRLLVGDLSAPRGGCLWGRRGRRGHLSHTSGLDADIGFLRAKPGKPSPANFSRDFEPKTAWWQLKKIFTNPYACVKVVFLDWRHKRKLEKVAKDDPDWQRWRRFVEFQPNHRDHFHVRVGDFPGEPGCTPNAHPELEREDVGDGDAGDELDPPGK